MRRLPPVVCRIFELCAAGKGPNQIARILTKEQIMNPTNQYYQETGKTCNHLDTTRPYSWCGKTVAKSWRTSSTSATRFPCSEQRSPTRTKADSAGRRASRSW